MERRKKILLTLGGLAGMAGGVLMFWQAKKKKAQKIKLEPLPVTYVRRIVIEQHVRGDDFDPDIRSAH